jgi:hypothetical protein
VGSVSDGQPHVLPVNCLASDAGEIVFFTTDRSGLVVDDLLEGVPGTSGVVVRVEGSVTRLVEQAPRHDDHQRGLMGDRLDRRTPQCPPASRRAVDTHDDASSLGHPGIAPVAP